MNKDPFCEFVPSRLNSSLSQCSFCGRTINNRTVNSKILCAKKTQYIKDFTSDNTEYEVEFIKTEKIPAPQQIIKAKTKCSQSQIDTRLHICKSCPFYQNNTCLQCGCSLSRDRVFMNKLYWPDQSCPIGKWGPVEPDNTGE